EAEDLTQEVFVEVYLKVQHFNEQAQLFTWIYRIAVNKCLEEQRRRKQQKRASYFKNLLGIGEEALDVEDKLNAHPGYSTENQDKAKFILAALEKLPENQRIAFTLMQTQGHSTKEVADIMNVSFSSVESLVFRAKKNLQKHLEKIKDDL
ncbi:MAG: RNA polymerase sigma factor, partial [Bacteroidetes bacterium]|nr:RNA polymerase sigma factor [Bacteroidota bacterium]